MIFRCNPLILLQSIIDPVQREKFKEKIDGREFPWGVQVKLYNRKTLKQNNAIWRDFQLIADLLYTTAEQIYDICRNSDYLEDHWSIEETVGIPGREKKRKRIRGLSELDKEEVSNLIPILRDFLKSLVEKVYQQPIHINWSCEENRYKPSYEFTQP